MTNAAKPLRPTNHGLLSWDCGCVGLPADEGTAFVLLRCSGSLLAFHRCAVGGSATPLNSDQLTVVLEQLDRAFIAAERAAQLRATLRSLLEV